VREKLEGQFVPNVERAEELVLIRKQYDISDHAQSSTAATSSFARRIWPKLHTIMANETGSFHLCGQRLRERWVGNDITIFSPIYAATEGLIGVNTDMNGKTYVLSPKAMFFEFLPMDESNNDDDGSKNDDNNDSDEKPSENTLFIEELEVGKEYEMIVTNLTGLYRYRFGDVIRCVGYHGESPIVEIAYRKGQFLNAQGERTSEETFYTSLSKTAEEDWNLDILDYSTVEYFLKQNGTDSCPCYTVYVELAEKNSNGKTPVLRPLTDVELNALDRQIGKANHLYEFFRSNGRLHRIEAVPVRPGTFEKLRKTMVNNLGTSPMQMKQPRVTRDPRLVCVLEEGAIDS